MLLKSMDSLQVSVTWHAHTRSWGTVASVMNGSMARWLKQRKSRFVVGWGNSRQV